jgi:hypothetical protein
MLRIRPTQPFIILSVYFRISKASKIFCSWCSYLIFLWRIFQLIDGTVYGSMLWVLRWMIENRLFIHTNMFRNLCVSVLFYLSHPRKLSDIVGNLWGRPYSWCGTDLSFLRVCRYHAQSIVQLNLSFFGTYILDICCPFLKWTLIFPIPVFRIVARARRLNTSSI